MLEHPPALCQWKNFQDFFARRGPAAAIRARIDSSVSGFGVRREVHQAFICAAATPHTAAASCCVRPARS